MSIPILFGLLGLSAAQEPKILSCIAGLFKCIGVPSVEDGELWGCQVDNITSCSGSTSPQLCGACTSPQSINFACSGQHLHNSTSQDGTPVTFSFPVDITSVKAEHFAWIFPDGSQRLASCAIPGGGPASEENELQTIAIVGDAGGWSSEPFTALEIVGDLMLKAPNGSLVSAKGLRYDGPSVNFSNGIVLLTADYETFSTQGETLKGGLKGGIYPNHCRTIFPDTTHRIRLLFDGGVSLDGRKEITPDRTDLIQVLDAAGNALPAGAVLGLADLGAAPMPRTQCEKDSYKTDSDNYLDVCLKMAPATPLPAKVHLPCTADKQICAPKGGRFPCDPQTTLIKHAELYRNSHTENSHYKLMLFIVLGVCYYVS